MSNSHARGILGLLAVTVTTFAIAMILCSLKEGNVAAEGNTAYVPPKVLPSLLIGPDELPWDAVLGALRVGSGVTPNVLGAFDGQTKFGEVWSGYPMQKPGGMMSPDYSIDIAVAVANSPEEAVSAAKREVASVAEIIPEITGSSSATSFADRVWQHGGRIVFTRGNVIGDVHMSQKGGIDKKLLFTLATRLSSKIDAALAGKPEAIPILPLAADQELRVDLEGAWKMRDLGARLWGNECTTIAIYDTNGIPRSLPAKRVGTDDYTVPLRHLAAIVGPNARVKVKGDEAKTTIKGKALVFNKGKSEVQADQRATQLDRPVEFAEGEVLVPFTSVVRNALGKGISWEQRGTTMIGRIE